MKESNINTIRFEIVGHVLFVVLSICGKESTQHQTKALQKQTSRKLLNVSLISNKTTPFQSSEFKEMRFRKSGYIKAQKTRH